MAMTMRRKKSQLGPLRIAGANGAMLAAFAASCAASGGKPDGNAGPTRQGGGSGSAASLDAPSVVAVPGPVGREAWCNFYDSENARARIGSCATSEARCVAWIEQTKHLEGAHSHTPCQRQEKVWCYRKVDASPSDITNCYPSEATCEQDLRAHYERLSARMTASESCSLIDAASWVIADDGIDRPLSQYSACISAFGTLPAFALFPPPSMAAERFSLNWCHDEDLPNWKERVGSIRDVCARTVTHVKTRDFILRVLTVLETGVRDFATKVCGPGRIGCWDSRGRGGTCTAEVWPRIERPSLY